MIHVIGTCTQTSLTLLPTGDGFVFCARHQTGSQHSKTLSPRVPKFSDLLFMLFGHIVARMICQGDCCSHFSNNISMTNLGYGHFYFCLKWLKFVGVYNFELRKQLMAIKV